MPIIRAANASVETMGRGRKEPSLAKPMIAFGALLLCAQEPRSNDFGAPHASLTLEPGSGAVRRPRILQRSV